MRLPSLTAIALCLCSTASAATMELLLDGGFESGLGAWGVADTTTDGSFFITPVAPVTILGTTLNGLAVPGDLDGDSGAFAAVTDQVTVPFGASLPYSTALFQLFTVPVDATSVTLTFENYIDDYPGPDASGVGIGPFGFPASGTGAPGPFGPDLLLDLVPEHYSLVDVLLPGADPLATTPADVVASVTNPFPVPAAPAGLNPWIDSPDFDLTGALTPGDTYMLRFGVVNVPSTPGSSPYIFGVDNVSIEAEVPPVPVPPALPLLAVALGGLALLRKRRRA